MPCALLRMLLTVLSVDILLQGKVYMAFSAHWRYTKATACSVQVGEIMDDRYEVFDTLGKGVFSTVLRARDTAHKNALGKHPEVAVKVCAALLLQSKPSYNHPHRNALSKR